MRGREERRNECAERSSRSDDGRKENAGTHAKKERERDNANVEGLRWSPLENCERWRFVECFMESFRIVDFLLLPLDPHIGWIYDVIQR